MKLYSNQNSIILEAYQKILDRNTISEIDLFFNYLCESDALDDESSEELKDWWSKVKSFLSKPVNAINNVLDKDKELIARTEENLKTMKKADIAAIYGMEFASSHVIDDLIDFIAMLKDVALFRYRKLPWRTAISAIALLAYILFPKNIKVGTMLFTAINHGFINPTNALRKYVSFGKLDDVEQMDTGSMTANVLDSIDELVIVYLLWKWFRRDLIEYRKWLIAKDVAKQDIRIEKDNKKLLSDKESES